MNCLSPTPILCYATVSQLSEHNPAIAASSLTTAEKAAFLLRAQTMVDVLVGFVPAPPNCECATASSCNGGCQTLTKQTLFPRITDTARTTNMGYFDPATGSLPCPVAAPFSYWRIAANGFVAGMALTMGEYLVATSSVQSCPADASAFTTQSDQPAACISYIPYGVRQATLLIASHLFSQNAAVTSGSSSGGTSTSTGSTGSCVPCLGEGDSISLGDFSYKRGTSSTSSSSAMASLTASLSSSQNGAEALQLLLNYTSHSFGIA